MQTMVSYGAKILNPNVKAFRETVEVFFAAQDFISRIIDAEWDALAPAREKGSKEVCTAVEGLMHRTAKNPSPKYDFDAQFPMFPSYLRRNAIGNAYGAVSSFRSNYANWEQSGKVGDPPHLTSNRHEMPCFYRNNKNGGGGMGEFDAMLNGETDEVSLKLCLNGTWQWFRFKLRHQDVKYLQKFWAEIRNDDGARACPPFLVVETIGQKYQQSHSAQWCRNYNSMTRRHRKSHRRHYRDRFYLRFPFQQTKDLTLNDIPLPYCTALSVDPGVNCDATCTVLNGNGTVAGRKFLNFPADKDRLGKALGRVKRAQREHGRYGGRQEWARVNRINDALAEKIAAAIVDYAKAMAVNVIVFEHLDMKGRRARGRNKQRLHLWRKNGIQEIVTSKAHNAWIRISHICAWGTSKLAFDGRGEVERGISVNGQEKNYSICRFPEVKDEQGNVILPAKIYNCDLSASYNIGARYFLRAWCRLKLEHPITFNQYCRCLGLDPKDTGKWLDALPCVPKRTYSHFYGMFHADRRAA